MVSCLCGFVLLELVHVVSNYTAVLYYVLSDSIFVISISV